MISIVTRQLLTKTGLPEVQFLAVSGGGENGAFGAGLLCGWSEYGTRPVFELVTGVSTGALTAPFAYLGSSYDPQLRAVYTELTPSRVLLKRSITAALFDDALTDNAPLFKTISDYLDEAMLAALAKSLSGGAPAHYRYHRSRCPAAGVLEYRRYCQQWTSRARWTRSAVSCSPPQPFPARSRRPCSM